MRLPDAISWMERIRSISSLSFDRTCESLLATVSPSSSLRGEALASRIWRFGLDGSVGPLTDGPNSDALPKASPTDDRIAFLSDRGICGKNDLYLLEPDGSVRAVGRVSGSIEDFHWAPDGTSIVVLAADRGLNGGATTGAKRLWWGEEEDPEVTIPGEALRRLFRVSLADGATDEVGPAGLTVWEFALVPGGAVAVTSPDASERGWHHPTIVRIDFATRRVTTIHQTDWQIQGLVPDADGRRIAFLEGWSSDRGLVAGEMRVLDLETGAVALLAVDQQSNVTALHWRDNASLWFVGWQGVGTVYGVVTLAGEILSQRNEDATLGDGPYVAQMATCYERRLLGAIRETIGSPQEVFVRAEEADDWRQLGDVNGDVARGYPVYPDIRPIRWSGRDGLPLEGFVYIPKGLPPGPNPMVVSIHGGPCMSAKHGFDPYVGLAYAAAGYIVFAPNYRGNVGWGQHVTRMNLGDPAGAEFEDILAGVDHCIEVGLADADRVGVTGISYGGYLSAWAVAVTDRFKAAIPISSICNQLSCHYSCEHDFHEFINGGSLREERYRRIAVDRSPLTRLDRPTTPTLLIQGREDRCTPVGQAQEFHTALRERGVETHLVIYPREGHFPQETGHRMDSLARQIAWFDRYLGLPADA